MKRYRSRIQSEVLTNSHDDQLEATERQFDRLRIKTFKVGFRNDTFNEGYGSLS